MAQFEFESGVSRNNHFPIYGIIGVALVAVMWPTNWFLPGPRTAFLFFPLWVGYCLTVAGLAEFVSGTSMLKRSWRGYILLFGISAPAWWLFEILNIRTQNWEYVGKGLFTPFQFFLLSTISFSVVMPAVFGTAELVSHIRWIRKIKPWLAIHSDRKTTGLFFTVGWVMLGLLLIWPKYFFPFLWLSVYFIFEPINIWMGNQNLVRWTDKGDWRPVISLFIGVLITGFFWEMWNYFSYPKWIYHVPGVDYFHIFEMPLLGYGGYLPFSLELFSLYHLIMGIFRQKNSHLIQISPSD